jgi:phosphoribosylformylglycinamidine (FGAM) synthase-like enzyme
MALAGNGRWCYLDPKLGAMHAVAEAARKVACTGATPVAATNCLNFGNPEKPEIMAQFSATIDGIAEACTALGTPITGGNVSFYNETRGEGIYPTPVIGIVGILDDVSKAVPSGFQNVGGRVLLLQSTVETPAALDWELGSSDFARTNCNSLWGTPPWINLEAEAALNKALISLAERGLIHSAKDVSDGGLATALAQASFAKNIGVKATLGALSEAEYAAALFAENAAEVLVTCSVEDYGMICTFLDEARRDLAARSGRDDRGPGGDPCGRHSAGGYNDCGVEADLVGDAGIAACGGGGDRMSELMVSHGWRTRGSVAGEKQILRCAAE